MGTTRQTLAAGSEAASAQKLHFASRGAEDAGGEVLKLHLVRAADLEPQSSNQAGSAPWSLDGLAGRVVELSGAAEAPCLSLACSLLRQAQEAGGFAVWVSAREDSFYPPDLAAGGVDLRSLPVVHLPDSPSAGRAADWLLRTGAFCLLVLDLGRDLELSVGLQGRLAQLARRQNDTVLILTEKGRGTPSLSSLVAVRAEAVRVRRAEGGYRCGVRFLKHKRRAPGMQHGEVFLGPPGLC
jgi:recombination protein RecA